MENTTFLSWSHEAYQTLLEKLLLLLLHLMDLAHVSQTFRRFQTLLFAS